MNKTCVLATCLVASTLPFAVAGSPIGPIVDYKLNRFQVLSDSGNVVCYESYIHLADGGKIYLTLSGPGILTFKAKSRWGYFNCYCDDWSRKVWEYEGVHSDNNYEDGRITISSDGLHTLVWKASGAYGDIANVKWNGVNIPLNIGPYLADTPIITPQSGTTFDTTLTITITCDDADSVIHYTTDGSDPTKNSPEYKKFRIFEKTTVKAIVIKPGWDDSPIACAEYALGTTSNPVISLADGSIFRNSNQVVSIEWNETDGILRYTLDGSEPTEESAEYTGTFQISETTTVKAKVFSDRYFDSDVVSATLTREWVQVETPVVSTAATFTGEKSRVTISCATDGAKIRYTLDGSVPNVDSEVYEGAFYVTNSCTIKAYATMDDCTDSAVASVSVAKVWGVGDTIGVPSAIFSDGGNANWVRDTKVGINGGESMKSGSIGNMQTSVLTAIIKGKGTFSFWWKTSCEDSGGYYDWDHAEFQVDGQTYYIDGETDWTQIAHEFTTLGEHELRWIYYKDDAGKDGSDCVWITAAQWDKDPIPEVSENPTVEDIEDALYGSRDARLMRRIATVSGYTAYRSWADKVCGQDFARRQVLRDSSNAWLAFMLDTVGLVSKSALVSDDVVIESIEASSAAAGSFDLVVNIADAEIGEDATSARLAEVFGVEGATELNESAFSSEGLTVTLERTTDGKAKAIVTPIGTPPTFFMRVKVK